MSMVSDGFGGVGGRLGPYIDQPSTWTPSIADQPEIKKILDEFKKASEAARVVDKALGTPDCVDPEKAKLLEKIERLEKIIDALLKEEK